MTQLRACSCRWSGGLWGCRSPRRRGGGGLGQSALDGGVPGAGSAWNLDRRAWCRLCRAARGSVGSKRCLRGRSLRRGDLSGYLYRWALRSLPRPNAVPTAPADPAGRADIQHRPALSPNPSPLRPKAKRRPCTPTPTPTPTPTRSRATDGRLRGRDLCRGPPPRWAQARAAGSSRWGSCERARAGGRWVSGAAARLGVGAGVASVRVRWTEACPARGRRGTWTAVLGVGWVVLPEEALVPSGASAEGPHARSIYPATCTGGRSAPPLNPPGWGTEYPLPPLTVLVLA